MYWFLLESIMSKPTKTIRQLQIADALLSLIAKGGFEAITIRAVAHEANYSVGLLQRQFLDKESLIQYAIEHCLQSTSARLEQHVKQLPKEASAHQQLKVILHELLSTDPSAKPQLIVWLAILGRASTDLKLANSLQNYYQTTIKNISKIIQEGIEANEFQPKLPINTCTLTLLSLLDGLCIGVLTGSLKANLAHEILETTINQVLQIKAVQGTP
jgi:AcrR family transcriptional regulator